MELTLHDAFSRLFGRTNQGLPQHLSSLGSYVLIHALIQHIYLLKQTSFATGLPYNIHRTMKPEDVEEVTQALRRKPDITTHWTRMWEEPWITRPQRYCDKPTSDSIPMSRRQPRSRPGIRFWWRRR
ncbi:hypothetical protein LB505_006330 [Fusarium chuoi]|nr:hypothetical protein LB505_006330 [Fusarium chuoi]